MEIHSATRTKLLQQVKRGRRTGAMQWTVLFVMLASAAELVMVVRDVHGGRGTLTLVVDVIVMVFILAMAAIGLGAIEMNERFSALITLLGEEKLLRGDG
jgi:hypothetical protein